MRCDVFLGLTLLVLSSATAGTAGAQTVQPAPQFKAVNLADVTWKDMAIGCAKNAILAGDPTQGAHHAYLKLSDGCHIPPHWHTADEYVTVVTGTVLLGIGEKADRAQAKPYGPGAFVFVPAHTPHYVWATGECILAQMRSGAVDFHWVNPADDPAKKQQKKRVEEPATAKGD
jgi:quercetin dioxygenase-like cupin family protein